jgi:predicted RNase H-like nuclease (RuvC/YqgF family)
MAEVKAREEKLQRELQEEEEEAQKLRAKLEESKRSAAQDRGVGIEVSQGDKQGPRGIVRKIFG